MAMYPNGRYMSRSPGRHFGVAPGLDVYYRGRNDRFNMFVSDVVLKTASTPSGYGIDSTTQPIVAGGLAANGTITGTGNATASAQSGQNILATVTGSGGVNNTTSIGLIVSIVATLIGSGGVTSATTQALAGLIATLTGSGNIAATARGLASLGAALAGSGGIVGGNTQLMAMAATIRGYGDLTPEGIRDTVWNAALAAYPTTGSAGKALSTASSGGVDLNALAAAVWTYTTRTLTAGGGSAPTVEEIANQVRIELEAELTRITKIAKIHGVGVPLVVTPTSRTAGDLAQTISTVGETTTVSSV